MPESNYQAILLRLGRNNQNEFVTGCVLPSLSSPHLKVTSFLVKNVHLKDDRAFCDLSVNGVVGWEWWTIWPGGEKAVERGTLVVNGADKPAATFEVKFDRAPATTSSSAPNDFPGHFEFEVKDVPVAPDKNHFKIGVSDTNFGIEGNCSWVVEFDFPDDENDAEPVKKEKQVTAGRPELIAEGSAGEIFLYTIAIKGAAASDVSKVVVTLGHERAISCHLTTQQTSGWHFLKRPDADMPLLFVFRPSYSPTEAAKEDHARHARGAPGFPGKDLPPREAFMAAYSAGIFFHGVDIVAGNGLVADRAVKLLPNSGVLVLQGHLSLEHVPVMDFDLPLPARFKADGFVEEKPMVLVELLWRLARLYRENDDKAREVTLCLLFGDFEKVGMTGIKFLDWRGELLNVLAEMLDADFKETKSYTVSEQGFWVGRGVGEALRLVMKPNGPCPLYQTDKADLFDKLLQTSLLEEEQSSSPPPKSSSLLEPVINFCRIEKKA